MQKILYIDFPYKKLLYHAAPGITYLTASPNVTKESC